MEVIELNQNPTLNLIRSYFGPNEEQEISFEYKGRKIIAQRKFTHTGSKATGKMYQVKTNYLHVWVQTNPESSTTVHYKECSDGSFEII